MLKGKYFNDGNFMTVGCKRNSSQTWRAIISGREALELGLIRRIGDGSSTRIWEDPWIPTNPGLKPIVKLQSSGINLVEELLNPDSGEWNEEFVKAKFMPVDARAILQIPTARLAEDGWAWHLERNGNFQYGQLIEHFWK